MRRLSAGEVYGAPRVPHEFVSRERLYALLDTDAALVVVRAPAGGGKTVAVADWAANSSRQHAGAWLSVREESASRLGFWRAVIQLLVDAGALPGASVLGRSIDSLDAVPDLRELLRRGFAQIPDPIVIVLDNIQLITDNHVHRDLVHVLETSPRLRAVVLTRTVSSLESEAVRLSLSSMLMQPSALTLSVEDTAAALALTGFHAHGTAFAEPLQQAVGGNPLLTRGIILAMQRGEIVPDVESIQDSLAASGARLLREAILARSATPGEVDFAVRCSVPAALTVELARALSGRQDAESLLAVTETSGLGMWAESSVGAVFTLSPVFRSALRAELDVRFPDEVARLHRTSAEWAHGNGLVFEALSHAIAARDLSFASTIVMQDWNSMLAAHRRPIIIRQIGSLPLRTLNRAPLLTMLLALAYNASGVHKIRAMEMFGVAVVSARLRGKKEPPPRRLVLLLIESAALRVIGRIEAALSAADRALSLRNELTVEDRDELARILPTFLCQIGQTYFYGGQRSRALELFREALAYPREIAQSGWFHGLSLTAGASALHGENDEATRLVEIARVEAWPEGWRDGYVGSMYHLAESVLALEEFDMERAQAHIDVLAPHLDTIEHWPLILHLRAMIHLAQGQATDAIAFVTTDPARHSRSLTSHTRVLVDSTMALLLVARGRAAEAEDLLKKHPRTVPAVSLGLARIALVSNRPEEAIRSVSAMLATEQDLSPRALADALLLRAAAASRLGRTSHALASLVEAAVLLRDRRMRFPLMLIPRSDLETMKRSADDAGVQLAGRLFEALEDIPDVLPASVQRVMLTEREQIVLRHLISTGNVAEIADALFVSANTVKSQLRSIYRKLGVTSREEALFAASELRVIQN